MLYTFRLFVGRVPSSASLFVRTPQTTLLLADWRASLLDCRSILNKLRTEMRTPKRFPAESSSGQLFIPRD